MVDKNIVVVGGNSGIGKTLIQKLQNSGANVFAFARNSNSDFNTIEWDVTKDLPDLSSLPEVIHGLVYLPGTINLNPFHRLKLQDFQDDLNINLLGAIKITQALINNRQDGVRPRNACLRCRPGTISDQVQCARQAGLRHLDLVRTLQHGAADRIIGFGCSAACVTK